MKCKQLKLLSIPPPLLPIPSISEALLYVKKKLPIKLLILEMNRIGGLVVEFCTFPWVYFYFVSSCPVYNSTGPIIVHNMGVSGI